MYDWIYFRVTGKTVINAFEWTLSHNCKKNSGKKLHNVTISSTCCSAGLEARCILGTQLYTQFSKMDHESNIQS